MDAGSRRFAKATAVDGVDGEDAEGADDVGEEAEVATALGRVHEAVLDKIKLYSTIYCPYIAT